MARPTLSPAQANRRYRQEGAGCRILITRADALSDDKYFQQAYKVYSNLIWLNGAVGTGASDEGGGADYRPTDAQALVLADIERDLNAAKNDYQKVMDTDVAQFNKLAPGRNLKPLAPK